MLKLIPKFRTLKEQHVLSGSARHYYPWSSYSIYYLHDSHFFFKHIVHSFPRSYL